MDTTDAQIKRGSGGGVYFLNSHSKIKILKYALQPPPRKIHNFILGPRPLENNSGSALATLVQIKYLFSAIVYTIKY